MNLRPNWNFPLTLTTHFSGQVGALLKTLLSHNGIVWQVRWAEGHLKEHWMSMALQIPLRCQANMDFILSSQAHLGELLQHSHFKYFWIYTQRIYIWTYLGPHNPLKSKSKMTTLKTQHKSGETEGFSNFTCLKTQAWAKPFFLQPCFLVDQTISRDRK